MHNAIPRAKETRVLFPSGCIMDLSQLQCDLASMGNAPLLPRIITTHLTVASLVATPKGRESSRPESPICPCQLR